MACGDETCFPNFYQKHNCNSVLICLESSPNSKTLASFENVIVSKKVDLPNLPVESRYQLLIIDSRFPLLVSKIFKNINYYFQRVDCLLTTVSIYFRDSVYDSGPVSTQLLSAVKFHQQLPFPILQRPSVARKRLRRKRFKFVKQLQQSEKRHCKQTLFNSHLLLRIESILQSSIGQDFFNLVHSLSEGNLYFCSKSIEFQVFDNEDPKMPKM